MIMMMMKEESTSLFNFFLNYSLALDIKPNTKSNRKLSFIKYL